MYESEIIKYIESGISRGLTLIEIKQSCFARGWSDYDIQKALRDSKIEEIEEKEKDKEELIAKDKDNNSIGGWSDSK